MLMRMYLRWAEQQGYRTEILDSLRGGEAGYKSVTISIAGPMPMATSPPNVASTGWCASVAFDEAHRRHTSFVLVEVMPEISRRRRSRESGPTT